MSRTGRQLLAEAVGTLDAAGVPDAAGDAMALMAYACRPLPRYALLPALGAPLSPEVEAAFAAHIAARARRQPVAQIIGSRAFWRHSFAVTPDTLDPRPETEVLVAEALRRPFSRLLDLGTGTGCILLSCLAERPDATGLGTDVSPAALAVAQGNATALGLAARARFQVADWTAGLAESFDLITSNPPYIAASEMAGLAPDVLNHEPHLALSPGGDGLDAYRAIARGAPARLAPGGRILLEIGPTQGVAVSGLLRAAGLEQIRILPDLDGRDRVVVAEKPADGAV